MSLPSKAQTVPPAQGPPGPARSAVWRDSSLLVVTHSENNKIELPLEIPKHRTARQWLRGGGPVTVTPGLSLVPVDPLQGAGPGPGGKGMGACGHPPSRGEEPVLRAPTGHFLALLSGRSYPKAGEVTSCPGGGQGLVTWVQHDT